MFEKVSPYHPDIIADRIAGAMLDLAYSKQENPRVAIEVLIGHGECFIIAETSYPFKRKEVREIVNRIVGKQKKLRLKVVPQDAHLAKNQEYGFHCGDNGIFKGVPVTDEQRELTSIAKMLNDHYHSDGKYILDGKKLIICQSYAKEDDSVIKYLSSQYDVTFNPLGYWTGGLNCDSGCIEGDALVETSMGLKRMKDINTGDEVDTPSGFYPVSSVIDRGDRSVVRITDKRGHSIRATDDHPFLVLRNGKYVFVEAKNICNEDFIVRKNTSITMNDYHLNRRFKIGRGDGTSVALQSSRSKQLWLLGYIIGDGWYNLDEGICFISCGTDEKMEFVADLIKSEFGYDARMYSYDRINNGVHSTDRKVAICSKSFCELLSNLGFKVGALNKQLPDGLLSLSDTNLCALVSGMFDSDGSIGISEDGRGRGLYTYTIKYSTSSYRLISDLSAFLAKIGIQHSMCKISFDNEKNNGFKYNAQPYVLDITGEMSKQTFLKRIGFKLHKNAQIERPYRKDMREIEFDDNRSFPCYMVAPLLNKDSYLKRRYALEKYCDNSAIRTHRNISYKMLTYVLDLYGKYDECEEYKRAKRMLDFDFVPLKDVVPDGSCHVYDIEVPNENCFVANGFIVHNCTNRKLGSDMGDSVTGGCPTNKDLSKADVSVNIYAWLKAQETGSVVELNCAIGDSEVDGKPFSEIMEIAREYINSVGGFEKFAEWGLIR